MQRFRCELVELFCIFKVYIQGQNKPIFVLVIAMIAKVSLIVEKVSLFRYVAS